MLRSALRASAASLAVASILPLSAVAAPLDRAKIVLPSATRVDLAANTVTLPLHRGSAKGRTVWYIITDASDAAAAKSVGAIYAPQLGAVGDAQLVSGDPTAFQFTGSVDFSPVRALRSGRDGSITAARPGSVGDADYTPFVRAAGSRVVYNAPIVASGAHPHDVTRHADTLDRVVAIDTANAGRASVTLVLARGFTAGQPIAYISTDASDGGAAAIERSTYAPRLSKTSRAARVPIFVVFSGKNDADGQGIAFAALHGGLGVDATAANAARLRSPLNIQSTFPAAAGENSGYTPLWNVEPAAWRAGARARVVRTPAALLAAVRAGEVTGPGGKPFGAADILVNCPVVAFAAERPR